MVGFNTNVRPLLHLSGSFRHSLRRSRSRFLPCFLYGSLFRRLHSSPTSWRRLSPVAPWPLSPHPTASSWRRRLRLSLHDSSSAFSWESFLDAASIRRFLGLEAFDGG